MDEVCTVLHACSWHHTVPMLDIHCITMCIEESKLSTERYLVLIVERCQQDLTLERYSLVLAMERYRLAKVKSSFGQEPLRG